MRGALAVVGAASVAAMTLSTPTPNALAANVLTVTGYTFGGKIDWEMDEIFQGSFCSDSSGNSCTSVDYNSGVSEGAEEDGLRALKAAMGTTAPPTVVVGFSQGATIATHWLEENAGTPGAPAAEDLSFVLAANPKRKYGGIRSTFVEPTPDTEYEVLDIAIEYDGAADFPTDPRNVLALANALAGFAFFHIPGYNNIDLGAEKLVWKEGNTTYVLIRRENLPLLEPLRALGLDALADRLNAPLKAIIDEAYDRDYPGLIDPEDHDDAIEAVLSTEDADGAEEAEDDAREPARFTAFAGTTAMPDAQESDELETDSPATDLEDDADTDADDAGEDAKAADESDADRGTTKADASKPSASDDSASDADSDSGSDSSDSSDD
ncbi:PE-PPE domain-containing protein [Mycobacterium sp. 236(2023)]|uniref:PE-PPE domain-containing protein n=1 Tax=Mycobacterium sp. 236(2023) TaxID=3038163 RepID=UPI0024155084|nr:PE-PPE domain-containing protein [Mycobacterium sp. 236(2023)]MDG4666718.1 PE-PPE domain-containing protein [Mycobacterium sp. 236(2023)]